jgi:hypothetical protein
MSEAKIYIIDPVGVQYSLFSTEDTKNSFIWNNVNFGFS